MESRAHANPYPDYLCSNFIKNGKLDKTLLENVDCQINCLIDELLKVLDAADCDAEYSVYTGYSGIAMFIMRVAINRNDKNLMDIADRKFQMAVDSLKKKRACFLNGDAGPLALCAIIKNLFDDSKGAEYYAKKLLELSNTVLSDKKMPNEILYGKAGFLYALLLTNKFVGDEVIDPRIMRNIAENILSGGMILSKCRKSCVPLEYEWHDKNYLGAAHGVSGILYVLLLAHKLLTDYELDQLVRPTLDWLLNNHRFHSGNFASSVGSDRDRLVQWCHGAPGFVHLLLLASEVFQDDKYKKTAIECGEVIWKRGLTCKGYSLCHGVSGNAYSFLQLYKATKDVKYWHRAACFADWCTKYPRNQGLQPDRPFSLYEGKAGMAYFLIDFKDPLESSFPGFDL